MKRIYIITLFLITSFTINAQRFDWAKGYDVDEGKGIVGAVTDSLGNLYILGSCDAGSKWDGEYLIPSIAKPSTKNGPMDVVIAKISAEGEMVWKKVIFGNEGANQLPQDIKKISDSTFACLVNILLPTSSRYCYYLDTFINGWSDYPIATRSGMFHTAFIVFDFSGTVIEQHFLQVSYIDTSGNDYRINNNLSNPIFTDGLLGASFGIDSEGNIYISRTATDSHLISVEDGTVIGLKFWVDNRLVGQVDVTDGLHRTSTPHIMKFSPHFDTLLVSRYVIQKSDTNDGALPPRLVKVDNRGKVYLICRQTMGGPPHSGEVVIDSSAGISFRYSDKSYNNGSYLVKFDSILNPLWVVVLDDSITDSRAAPMTKYFGCVDFDYDSNLLFLSASVLRNTNLDTVSNYSMFLYRGIPLPLRNYACVLSFYNNDTAPILRSCAVVPSIQSFSESPNTNYNLFCNNNRIFIQSQYYSGINFPSQAVRLSNRYKRGIALTVFDYSGHVIDGIDYGIETDGNNYPGSIVLHDSVLYLLNQLNSSPTFGNITVPVYGCVNVIARYVDTAFMHPYVRPTHSINTVTAEPELTLAPNPTTGALTVSCEAAIEAVELYDIQGRCALSRECSGTSAVLDLKALPAGSYVLVAHTAKGLATRTVEKR